MKLAQFIEHHGDLGFTLIKRNFTNVPSEEELDELSCNINATYIEEYSNLEEWARDELSENLPEDLEEFFDFATYAARKLESGDIYYVRVKDSFHVFKGYP